MIRPVINLKYLTFPMDFDRQTELQLTLTLFGAVLF